MITKCYGGSNVLHMLILHLKCSINVPTSCVQPGTCRNIWNVPNLLLAGKWWVPSTRACNVLKMFLLVSRPPHPQCVFVAPPTEDSSCYSPRAVNQLLVPNSYHPVSLVNINSVAVISYKYLLVEYLDMLNSLPPQAGHASVYQVETLRSKILNTLQYLDQRRGDEWNKQLQAQLDPNTFIISGKDQCTP